MLELRVQPNDEEKVQKRNKDVSTLSGGEKSFSTICLLLALWHAAGCPIRGLDEYDVFMDPVNRKIATNMVRLPNYLMSTYRLADILHAFQLIEAGHAANHTQMILISPQAITGYKNTPGVKIIRIVSTSRADARSAVAIADRSGLFVQADPERGQGTLATNATG